jgi:hypothetical protein
MGDHRPLHANRRRLDGLAGEYRAMAPAYSQAWAAIESIREMLATRVEDPPADVMQVRTEAAAQLENIDAV